MGLSRRQEKRVIAASLAWLTPRPAPERVPLTFGHVHISPPWSNLLKKGVNRLGLSSGIRRYIWKSVEVAKILFWRPTPKKGPPPGPPPPSADCTRTYINRQILMRGFRIYNGLTHAVQKLHLFLPPGLRALLRMASHCASANPWPCSWSPIPLLRG